MLRTVESVTAGQADKICDQVADALVDECLRRDPHACLNLHVLGSHGMLMIGGELSSLADFDMAAMARSVYAEIGYTDDIEIFVNVEKPSDEISALRGPSDAISVSGYATRETREMLPRPLVFAHALSRRLDDMRRFDPQFSWLKPDGKAQVCMEKDRMHSVTLLASHAPDMDTREVKLALLERIIYPVIGTQEDLHLFVNPAGAFTKGGFAFNAGVNGRQIASDTYGGLMSFGDHALSGKDPLKAERAGAYMTRAVARFLVEQGLVSSAFVTASYTFGRAEPIALEAVGIDKTRGLKINMSEQVQKEFDFRPEAIVERLNLRQPLYRDTATHGHFGRPEFPWEQTLI